VLFTWGIMQKVIKLTDKVPRVDINHYLAASDEDSRVVVLSERDVTVIRSYMFPGVEWETRFIRPLGGDNYETGTTEEFSEYQEAINELDYKLSGGLTMSLESALTSIAEAIGELANSQSRAETVAEYLAVQGKAGIPDLMWTTLKSSDLPSPVWGQTVDITSQRVTMTSSERKLAWLGTQVRPTVKWLQKLGLRDEVLKQLDLFPRVDG